VSHPELIIYVNRHSGLANRVRALIGYRALSLCCNTPFAFYWGRTPACDAEFDELFVDPPYRHIKNRAQLKSLQNSCQVFEKSDWPYDIWYQHARGSISWEIFAAAASMAANEIIARDSILDIVNKFSRIYSLSKAAGFHIRRTDNIAEYKKWNSSSPGFDINRISNFNKFYTEIIKKTSTQRFFLSTDSPLVEMLFRIRFRRNMISYGHKVGFLPFFTRLLVTFKIAHRRRRSTNASVALIDLLLLGKCCEIFGTYYSSYSRLAAILGKVPYFEVQGDRIINDIDLARSSCLPLINKSRDEKKSELR